jgi:hypothetical protein
MCVCVYVCMCTYMCVAKYQVGNSLRNFHILLLNKNVSRMNIPENCEVQRQKVCNGLCIVHASINRKDVRVNYYHFLYIL